MKKDPYATAEESASVMAKGLTTERRAAIQAVGRMMDELDTNEQGVSDEYHVKSLYDVAYKLAEQRAELLGALKLLEDCGILSEGELGDDPQVLAAQKAGKEAIEKCEEYL